MRIKLLEYQDDATRDVLNVLDEMREVWETTRGTRTPVATSVALSSGTGSGKTVIAASVIESLLHGSTEFDVDPIPGAVVLWVSKDPALNVQTRARFVSVADRIPVSDLVLLDAGSFAADSLQAGTVYFINPDKLRDGGKFVTLSNDRQVTFWEVLANTIRDPAKTLYVVLDEAHQGTRTPSKADADKAETLVMRIINGTEGGPAAPIVWGISATPERFDSAMSAAKGRTHKSPVIVDQKRVQESGLIKESVILDAPDEDGDFDTVMVRAAATEFAEVCRLWDEYCGREGEREVFPLLIVQIPPREDGVADTDAEDQIIGDALEAVRSGWPEFTEDCVAHVLGDRGLVEIGPHRIPKVQPEEVQEDTRIRVLIAKDAISTGWDCPRAEVLVSLRSSRGGDNDTYVTQLLGRMLRTPLARSTNDDRLNSVLCLLPRFNAETLQRVVARVTGDESGGGGSGGGLVGRVIRKPKDLAWNPNVSEEVRALIQGLPSYARPAVEPKPIKRLLRATVEFALDGLVPSANELALETLSRKLDGIAAEYKSPLRAATESILQATIRRTKVTSGVVADESTLELPADINSIKAAVRYAERMLTPSVVKSYLRREVEDDFAKNPLGDTNLIRARVAAFAFLKSATGELIALSHLANASEALVDEWLKEHRAEIALLPESRRSAYDQIRRLARTPAQSPVEMPTEIRVDTVDKSGAGLKVVDRHVYADPSGKYPIPEKTNDDERAVIDRALKEKSIVAWYRNPDSGVAALSIPYQMDGEWRLVQPDVLLIHLDSEKRLRPSLVDPHGAYFSDAIPKLLGIVEYVEKHGGDFVRVESLANIDGVLRMLDMKREDVRAEIRRAAADPKATASGIFGSSVATDF